MRTTTGNRDAVVDLLVAGAPALRDAGCLLYVVSTTESDPDLIIVNEIWESREHHHASLQLPSVREAIAKARPMLTGEMTGQETTVAGGLGLGARA